MVIQPASAEEWEPYLLPEKQIASFTRNGFITGIRILDEERVEILNNELARFQTLTSEERALF